MGDEMSYIENEKLRNFLYRNLFLKKLIQISYLYKRQHTLRHKKNREYRRKSLQTNNSNKYYLIKDIDHSLNIFYVTE